MNPSENPPRPHKRLALLVAALAIAVAFAFQGTRGIQKSTECRYAETAREMLSSGNWLVPTLRDQPHWTKPPLTYWILAAGMELLGRNAWGARLPVALAFLASVWAVYALGKTLWNPATGLVSAILYATSPFAIVAGNVVSTDMFLALWQLLVVLAYWKAVRSDAERPRRAWILALWFFAGLAFFTKGPVGLLALLAVLLFHTSRKRRRPDLPRLFAPAGIALFLLTAFAWYGVVILRYPDVLGYWLRVELLGRIAGSDIDHNPQWYKPFMFYLPILLFGLGLWTFFWPVLAYRRRADLGLSAVKRLFASSDPALFLGIWLLVPLAILFGVRSRLPLYVLPLFPVVALATARAMELVWPEGSLWRKVVPIACCIAVAAVAVKAVVAYLPSKRDDQPLAQAVLANATPDTAIIVLDRPEKYGLLFYLDGRLRFATMRPKARPADRDAADLVREIASRPRHPRYLIIYKESAAEFELLLREASIPYARLPAPGGYGLLLIAPLAAIGPQVLGDPPSGTCERDYG